MRLRTMLPTFLALLSACKLPPVEDGACVATTEVCNGVDDDCDGFVDNFPSDGVLGFRDEDADGSGNGQFPWRTCELPAGYALDGDDCDDADPRLSPWAPELCDGMDQDCDGVVDNDAIDGQLWFPDLDRDGHGDANAPLISCLPVPDRTPDGSDCDDADPLVWNTCETDCPECVPEYLPLGNRPIVALGDANGDGFGDLLVDDHGMRVAFGRVGFDGSPSDAFVPGDYVCAEDFDGDGRLDVLSSKGPGLMLTLAPFGKQMPILLGEMPPSDSVICADLDGTRSAEIVFVRALQTNNDCGGTSLDFAFWWNPGQGDVTARSEVTLPGGGDSTCEFITSFVAAAPVQDVTGDAFGDLVITRESTFLSPDGSASPVRDFVVAKGPFLDGIGLSELVLDANNDATALDRVRPVIPRNTAAAMVTSGFAARAWSAESLAPAFDFSGGSTGFTMFLVGDLHGDGLPDMVVSDQSRRTAMVFDDPAGSLTGFDRFTELAWPFGQIEDVLSDDFDGDGKDDLVIVDGQPPGGLFVPGASLP